jgi:hypothetical protein
LPACLVVGEATWVALLVNASYNASQGPHVRLPFLGFAVAPVVALTAVASISRFDWRWWRRAALVGGVVVIGAAVTAGCITALTVPSASWKVATEPWTSRGHRMATVAGAAWFVTVAAWVRGTWLGVRRPAFAHAARSAALSATVFVGIFAGRAAAHDVAFRATTGDAGALLFVFVPLTGTALLLIRQQELEREVLLRSSSGPGMAWLSVLGAPLLAIAGLSLLAAVAAGPAVRGAGRAGLVVLRAIGWVFAALGRLFRGGAPGTAPVARRPTVVQPAQIPHLPTAHHVVTVPGAVWDALGALAGVLAVWFLVKYVRPFWPRRWRPPPTLAAEEERDSVFTWKHLRAQVAGALRRLLQRLLAWLHPVRRRQRARQLDLASVKSAGFGDGVSLDGVRADYLRVLVAARQSGSPRAPAETANEFEMRLAPDLRLDAPAALHDLTGLYRQVRYGNATLSDPERLRARDAAFAVVDELARTVETTEGSPPATPSG